jgi:serine/threonine protein kinase/formylglycine-generating enzyme required for sulfatase activity
MSYRVVQKGDRISEYTLIEKLGQGGFGEVWKAEHSQIPGKWVAIKIPTRPESMVCLRQEALFQHELDHPNIVKTIGLNTQSDPPYFIMEYVEGKNLRQFMLEDGILPPPYAIDIAIQVCEALAFAHGKGIVHKDIKPENILIEKKRVDLSGKVRALLHCVKITDLGLGMFPGRSQSAIVISESARTSGVRILSGTLFYMAPEQMAPDRQVDARADLYSLGVVLYEMLTGEIPLGMDLPSELNPVVTSELDAICKRALSIDRDTRYLNARELAADLQKAKELLLHKLPVKRSRRRPYLEGAFATFVLALFVLCGLAFVRIRRTANENAKSLIEQALLPRLSGPLGVHTKPAEAEVWLDGHRMGLAPIQLPPVTFERHTLRLAREFYEPRELLLEPRTVEGRPCFAIIDRTTRKEMAVRDCATGFVLEGIELSRHKGWIALTTPGVAKASVTINGHFYGVTPFTEMLDAGIHHVTISKEGFHDLSFYEKIEGGARVSKPLSLLSLLEAVAAGAGTVVVHVTSSPTAAMVTVNDEEKGQTPLELEVAPGTYAIRLSKKYHAPRTVTLTVDSPVSHDYELVKVRARVAFDSEPQGATVQVDGENVGVTPVTAEAIEGGSHQACFVLAGHYDQSASFEIVSRDVEDRPIKATLQKIPPAWLVIDSDLRGAEAFLDGKPLGRLPVTARSVESGAHRLRVMGVERTVDLEAGVEKKVHFGLKDLNMARVPEGDFMYGSVSLRPGEVSARTEKTGAYYVDRTEVTNEQYGFFLAHMSATQDHGGCHPEEDAGTRQRNHRPAFWQDPLYGGAGQPVVGVTWHDAYAYAVWAGKRLPTEREWEKAARGKTGWIYPWGNDWAPDEKRCNFSGRTDGYEHTAPVGACPGVSPFGCADMVGNVSEWCADDFPGKAPGKVIRGGSFRDKEWVTTTSRWDERPGTNSATLGFRCVADEKK